MKDCGHVDLADLRLCAARMVRDLHDLDEVALALQAPEKVAVHALNVGGVEDHAYRRAPDRADDRAAFIEMRQQHARQRSRIGRLEAKRQAMGFRELGCQAQGVGEDFDLPFARTIRVLRRENRHLLRAELSGCVDGSPQGAFEPRPGLVEIVVPKRRADLLARAANDASRGQASLDDRPGDRVLLGFRPRREPGILDASKSERRRKLDLSERVRGPGACRKQRNVQGPKAEMRGVSQAPRHVGLLI